ncbi:addiction module protein, partial [Patescibacteria group bacterium]|nr:addiction module protein [Patescibacteria group bacterium]
DRARLAMNLIKSLDNHDDADVEELWLQEAERRYHEYRQGKLQTRSADDVFRDAFSKVR